MDNDLAITDCSPGFGSAAKYLATSLREAAFDLAAMSRASTQVFVLEVMGRHAGWTTAACALAAEQEGDAPHVLLLPEVAFNEDRFLAKVTDAFKRYGHCVIAVSEGVKTPEGQFLSAGSEDDQEKRLPADFISPDGFGITQAARRYLAPLIIGESYPPFKEGLPDYVKLRNVVAPKLASTFTVPGLGS